MNCIDQINPSIEYIERVERYSDGDFAADDDLPKTWMPIKKTKNMELSKSILTRRGIRSFQQGHNKWKKQ